ncbi:MAG: outer membrane beta-barrel protein [Bacteroidota bacterium]
MKKTVLLISVLSVLINTAYSQEFYLRAGVGYALPHAGQSIAGNEWPYNGTVSNSVNYNIQGASFAAGLQAHVGAGYLFTDHIGIQLDATFGLANTVFTFRNNNVLVYYTSGSAVLSNVTIDHEASFPLNLLPSLVLQTGGDKCNVYSRMGLAVPLNSKVDMSRTIANVPGTGALTVTTEKWEMKHRFSLGFTAAAGVEYKIGDDMSIWGELSLLSMSAFIKESNLKSYVYNGRVISPSQLSGVTSIKYGTNITLDTNDFSRQPAYTQPFSNVSFNAGIRYTIPARKRKAASELDDNKKKSRF